MAHRLTLRLDDDDYDRIAHWAEKSGRSITDFLVDAADFKISWELRDFDLAPLEVQRLNQLMDLILSLSSNVQSLESVVTSGFGSLLGLTRGDNYLLESDGE